MLQGSNTFPKGEGDTLSLSLCTCPGLALRFEVPEEDVLLLEHMGITTCNAFASRYPGKPELKEFIDTIVRTQKGSRNPEGDTIVVERDNTPLDPSEFSSSKTAANLRLLWGAAEKAASKDMDKLVADMTEDRPKTRLTPPEVEALIDDAADRGVSFGDKSDRPGDMCISRTVCNYAPQGGRYEYQPLEEFVSQQDEEAAAEQGQKPKVGFRLVATSSGLHGEAEVTYLMRVDLTSEEILALKDCLKLRASTLDVARVCRLIVVLEYNERVEKLMRCPVPAGYRNPTILEFKRFDRTIFNDALSGLKRGKGSVAGCLEYYLRGEGASHPVWKMLDYKERSRPDEGLAQPLASLSTRLIDETSGARARDRTPRRNASAGGSGGSRHDGQSNTAGSTLCNWCNKPRSEHPGKDFYRCPKMPAHLRSNAKGKKKGIEVPSLPPPGDWKDPKKGRGKGDKSGKKGGKGGLNLGPHWADTAAREESTPNQREGKRFCFNFHNSNYCKNGDRCHLSHRCPKFVDNGSGGKRICGEVHPLYLNHPAG